MSKAGASDRQPSLCASSFALCAAAPLISKNNTGIPAGDGLPNDEATFDLASFLASTLTTPAPATVGADDGWPAIDAVECLATQVNSLSALVLDLRGQISAASVSASTIPTQPRHTTLQPMSIGKATSSSWTLPASSLYELPPIQLRELRTASFPAPTRRFRGEYSPHPTHVLAAYRSIPSLSRTDGAFTPPTDTLFMAT
ncbi:hypothetical protein PF008_g21369 [Phytophthora fragariae]|uniref:Uncharacterized protein n=1 Tax=Phytophthora fragariae TaxID=53985 RepID=A0A6G0QXU0_9STRA|nr:hypothetical protein PF008_g21369 [Phytophthora fragariae]